MSTLKCGVVGTGYLGRFHAEKYARIADCELAAVSDADEEICRRVAAEYSTAPAADYRELLGKLDAVSVVTPTPTHHRIALDFLENGAHVLVEKPMTSTLEQADELIAAAERSRKLLQVGHIERFNPALFALGEAALDPLFIESTRLMPADDRDKGACVILDLMIHDLDIILELVRSEIADVRADGIEVLAEERSGEVDIANARIEFANGCTANVTASRISRKIERKLRLFKKNRYFSIDLHNNRSTACRKGAGRKIECEERSFPEADALLTEIEHFLACIRERRAPLVGGHEGRRALDAATRVAAALRS